MAAATAKKIDHSPKKEKAERKSLPDAKRRALAVGKFRVRFGRVTKKFKLDTWPPEASGHLKAYIEDVERMLTGIEDTLNELPDDVGKKTSKSLEAGMLVNVREGKRGDYAMVAPNPKDLEGMKVEKVEGSKVLVITQSGVRVVLPRGHVAVS